jgi:hypothetical protein
MNCDSVRVSSFDFAIVTHINAANYTHLPFNLESTSKQRQVAAVSGMDYRLSIASRPNRR